MPKIWIEELRKFFSHKMADSTDQDDQELHRLCKNVMNETKSSVIGQLPISSLSLRDVQMMLSLEVLTIEDPELGAVTAITMPSELSM
jgi:flagellar motor switch protein FliM